ncbi:tetratricopeptide repeat protein [Pseudomonas abietaniphila]|uniref:tetratricopeptide repeat protein n=1 Tax=Pseudomonas abietaniphila TaxID=89065 RepID=UPI0032173E3A
MSVPKTKSSEITEKINLLSQQAEVSPFEVKSLQRDIDRLKQSDASESYMLGGMLRSILNDYPGSKELHEKSLKLSYSLVEIVNYAVSMKRLGRSLEALPLYCKAAEMDPANPDHVSNVLQLMTFIGDFEKYDAVLGRFQRANPDFDITELTYVNTIESIRTHLDVVGVPESQFKIAGALVEKALTEFGFNSRHMLERLSNFDGVSHVYVELAVDAKSASELVQVNDRVVQLILECDELTCWDRLVYNVVSFHPPVTVDAA